MSEKVVVSLFNPKQWSVDLNDVIKQLSSCDCNKGISTVQQIFQTPSCDSGISSLSLIDSNVIAIGSNANSFCTLDNAKHLYDNDLMLYTDMDTLSSYKVRYQTLKNQLINDISTQLCIRSMAFRDRWEYSKKDHTHNGLYTKIQFVQNPKSKDSVMENGALGTVSISTDNANDTLVNRSHLSTFSGNFDIAGIQNIIETHYYIQIGTLKFIGIPTMQNLIQTYSLSIDSDSIQVNMYDSNNKIRSDYDGWVFPNGSTILNIGNQLSDAAKVYAGSYTATSFTVPNLSSFFKANPKTVSNPYGKHDYYYDVLQHTHSIPSSRITCDISLDSSNGSIKTTSGCAGNDYIHQGNENKSGVKTKVMKVDISMNLNNAKITNLSTDSNSLNATLKPEPSHQVIPIMIYIGGEIN